MTNHLQLAPQSLVRMVLAVERVRERLQRSVAALEQAGISYAVIDGNAIADWVSRVDITAVRNTVDVDLLVRREDFERVKEALVNAGFIYAEVLDVHAFLDGPEGTVRNAVHLLFAGEKVKPEFTVASPDVTESERGPNFQVLKLEPLVRMKLISYRRKDQVHLQDLISLGLVDSSWLPQLPDDLHRRLQELLDDPNG